MENVIVLDKPINYDLRITMVAETWYNNMVGGIYEKRIRADQLDEIRNDPLQDYIKFGFQRVLFVDIEIYPEYKSGDYIIRSNAPDDQGISAWYSGGGFDKEKVMDYVDEMIESLINGTLPVERIH